MPRPSSVTQADEQILEQIFMDFNADIPALGCSAVFGDIEQVQGDLSHSDFLLLDLLHDLRELVRSLLFPGLHR